MHHACPKSWIVLTDRTTLVSVPMLFGFCNRICRTWTCHLMPSDHFMRPWHHTVVIRKRRQKCLSRRQVATTQDGSATEIGLTLFPEKIAQPLGLWFGRSRFGKVCVNGKCFLGPLVPVLAGAMAIAKICDAALRACHYSRPYVDDFCAGFCSETWMKPPGFDCVIGDVDVLSRSLSARFCGAEAGANSPAWQVRVVIDVMCAALLVLVLLLLLHALLLKFQKLHMPEVRGHARNPCNAIMPACLYKLW